MRSSGPSSRDRSLTDTARFGRRRGVALRWVVVLFALAAGAAGAVAWRLLPERHAYCTDADTIRVSSATVSPRDVLWQPPTKMPDYINSTGDDYEPRLSADGLTLYFVRGKAGHNADIHIAERTADGWSDPQPLAAINSAHDDLGPEPSPDGRLLYFYSNRPGGSGGYDLWAARRGSGGEFATPTNLGPLVNSRHNDYGPAVTPDGATLYFASNRPRPEHPHHAGETWPATVREDLRVRDYDLYVSAINQGGVGRSVPLTALNTPHHEGTPAVSPAGDFVYFSSDRPGGIGGFDLFRSRRLHGAHQPPEHLGATVNSPANELDPALSMGGYGLHFSSDRPAESATPSPEPQYDLYYTTSREVFTEVETISRHLAWAAILDALGPSLWWALAVLILLSLLRHLGGSTAGRQLSLLTKCLIGSVLAHAVLMLVLSVWEVSASLAGLRQRDGGVRVALVSPAPGRSITAQVRGEVTEFVAPAMMLPPVERRTTTVAVEPLDVCLAVRRMRMTAETEKPAEPHPIDMRMAGSQPPQSVAVPVNRPAAVSSPVELDLPVSEPGRTVDEPVWKFKRAANVVPSRASLNTFAPSPDVMALRTSSAAVASEAFELPSTVRADATPSPTLPGSASPPPHADEAPPRTGLELAVPAAPVAADMGDNHEAPERPMPNSELAVERMALRPVFAEAPLELRVPIEMANMTHDLARTTIPAPVDFEPAYATPVSATAGPPVVNRARVEPMPIADLALPAVDEAVVVGGVYGRVLNALTGEPIADAAVRLDLTGTDGVEALTDDRGGYQLQVPEVPEFFALSASGERFVPASANVAAEDVNNKTIRIDFHLQPDDLAVVAVEAVPDVHHLGDDDYGGAVNSRFQKRTEGASFIAEFKLSGRQVAPYVGLAEIGMLAKGVQMSHPIYINGVRLRHRMSRSPRDGRFGEFVAPFDPRLLRVGMNTVEIRAKSRAGDIDDFEFVNVRLRLVPPTDAVGT